MLSGLIISRNHSDVIRQQVQSLMNLDGNNLNYTEQIPRCILDCIERFAPVTEIKAKENTADSITNTIQDAITKRNQLFQNWTKSPSVNNNKKYKKQRFVFTSIIRNAKRDPIHRAEPFTKTWKIIYQKTKSNLKFQISQNLFNILQPLRICQQTSRYTTNP